jgi:hypothetical protein
VKHYQGQVVLSKADLVGRVEVEWREKHKKAVALRMVGVTAAGDSNPTGVWTASALWKPRRRCARAANNERVRALGSMCPKSYTLYKL